MKVRALKLRDESFGTEWAEAVENRWVYEDFKRNEKWRRGWISFDCALYSPGDDRVYCGVTSFDSDIFTAYDRRAGRFVDLGVRHLWNGFDAKFHRSLLRGGDGAIYAAVALLHCIDRFEEAPGGAVIRYEPATGRIEKLGIPVPHVYIQSLVIDERRRTAYGLGFHPQCLLAFDLDRHAGRFLGYITSGAGGGIMSENLAIDDAGCVWSCWGLTRAWAYDTGPDAVRLCKYDPHADRIVFFQKGLPRPDGRHGFVEPESFHNFGDGWIYAGGRDGALYRIDPATADAEHLCAPVVDRPTRLASLVKAEEGTAYGVVGRDGRCDLVRFDYRRGGFELLGPVREPGGAAMHQCHDIVMAGDGTLYACENDNVARSGYLWEISL